MAGAGAGFAALGAGGGLSGEAAPGGTPRPPPCSSPHKGADGDATLTGQSGLRAPASGRAGRLAGGCASESVRVSACVPVSVCASVRVCVCRGLAKLCASACAGASVRGSVRPALCPAFRARSLAGPPHQMRLSCGVAGAAAGWVRHPPSPGSAPPPGGLVLLPGNCAGRAGLAGGGRGALAAPRARVGPGRRPLILT